MEKRISMYQLEPGAYEAMIAMENYGKGTQVPPILKELIKIRASQINGCAYCLDMHTEDAIKIGETPRRIFLLSAWREAPVFTEEERAVLQLTEEVTLISKEGLTTKTYETVIKFFGEKITAQLIMLVVIINGWNRIAIATNAVYK